MQTRARNQKKRLILQIINRFIFKKLIFYTVQSMIDITDAHYPHLISLF